MSIREYACPARAGRRRSPAPAARSSSSCARAGGPSSRKSTSSPLLVMAMVAIIAGDWDLTTAGPTLVVTDLCLMCPHQETRELMVVSLHEGVSEKEIVEATGWPIRFADVVEQTPPPTDIELEVLRDLQLRTSQSPWPGGRT